MLWRLLVICAALLLVAEISFGETRPTSDARLSTLATTLSIKVVRTGSGTASVLGITDGVNEAIDVLVNDQVVVSGVVSWIGQYWFLNVPVSDGASVKTRIGSIVSPVVTVPAYVAQPVGPAGFIYAQGANLAINGTPIQLFGVDEQTVFLYALIASGLWGTADPGAWGKNQLFPSGPEAQITNVSDADSLFQKYFQYFLHYNQVAGTPANPKVNLLRVWVSDDSWYPEGTYLAWKNNATAFWNIFDKMVYWANRSGVYLVPVLGHFATNKDNRFFDTSDIRFAHQVEVVNAIMDHYDSNPTIAMWDLWNEPDVDNDVYWASVGGITGFTAWASTYIADVKPHSPSHLITIGIGGWTLFPGVPDFGWPYEFFWGEIPGLEVGHHHTYGTAEDQYLIDWQTDWDKALGIPHYEGEVGYNAYPGPSPLGYGYWPWYSQTAQADGVPAMSTMVFLDNGKGVYADYPYLGALPDYPPPGSPPPTPPPPPPNDTTPPATVTDLRMVSVASGSVTLRWTAPGDDGMIGNATWYDFRYTIGGPITAANFGLATHYELPFFPHAPGTTEEATIPGLQDGTTYWFALQTSDEVPNWSGPSNSPSAVPGAPANLPPIAASAFSPATPLTSQMVTFNASASYDPDGTINSYAWTFGDGASGQGRTSSHAYANTGLYTATLTVTDNGGMTGTKASSVPVAAPAADRTPPAAIADLQVVSVGKSSVTLQWTAPGDDGMSGQATWYDLRLSTSGPITASNFSAATHTELPFFPHAPGTTEQVTVSGLARNTRYWFAIRASDEVPNWSGVSNSPTTATPAGAFGRTRAPGRACILCLLDFPSDFGAAIATPSGIAFLVLCAVGIALLVLALRGRKPRTKSPASTREPTDEMLDAMLEEIYTRPPSGVRGPR